MNYILYDGSVRTALLPFTYTRPVADLRIGILTIREKWEFSLGFTTTTLTEEYLEAKYPIVEMEENIMINASVLPSSDLVEEIRHLQANQGISYQGEIIAFFTKSDQEEVDFDTYEIKEHEEKLIQIKSTWDLFKYNDAAINNDFKLVTNNRKSASIPEGVRCYNRDAIFIEEGATVFVSVLNANTGPIYIGKDALVMEGSLIRGPFSLGEAAVVKMGAKIYGATTIGPGSKVGGEINNSILFANSNKGHEGYLGNSVLGEWCNLGADTNNSNLKNNYAEVRVWNYESEGFDRTGLQFCGLMMGDHSKCAINTMFNTGTVVGVSANIFGSGFPRNFIPSFSWGGPAGFSTYALKKALDTAKLVVSRRLEKLDQKDVAILEAVFNQSKKYRTR